MNRPCGMINLKGRLVGGLANRAGLEEEVLRRAGNEAANEAVSGSLATCQHPQLFPPSQR